MKYQKTGMWLWPLFISIFLVIINFGGYYVIVTADMDVPQKLVAILILSGCVVMIAAFFCVVFYLAKTINDIGAIAVIVLAFALVLVDLTLRFVLQQHFLGE